MSTSLTHITHTNAPPPPSPLSAEDIRHYLDYVGEPLRERRDALLAALDAMKAVHASITDDDTLGTVAENMRMAAALARVTEERRKDAKNPFLEGGRCVDDWFKRLMEPLQAAMRPLQAAMNAYAALKLARERAEAEEARRIAEVEAQRAAAAAAKMLARGQNASTALDAAAESAARAAEAEAITQMRPAELTRTRGVFGAVASARETWTWRVTDLDAVPRAYLMLNPDAVKAAGKQRDKAGKPLAVITGIEWVPETKMGVR